MANRKDQKMRPFKFIHTVNETEPEMARREYITRNVLFFLFMVAVPFTLISFIIYLSGKMPIDTLIIYSIISIMLFGAMFLAEAGYWRAAGIIPPLLMYFPAVNGNYIGGIDAPGNFMYALMIMFVAIIYGYRKMWIALVICLATYLCLAWMISIGYIKPFRTAEVVFISRVVITSGSLVIIALMIWILSRSYRNEIDVRIKAEELLKGKNKELSVLNESLRESEELYTKLIATMPDIMVRMNLKGEILFINDVVLSLGGYESKELIGQNMFSIIDPEDHDRAARNTVLMFERRLGPQEYHLITKDGRKLLFEVNGDILRNGDGSPYGLVQICRDITDRKHTEEKLQTTLESLRKSFAATIQVMVSAVESRDPYTSGHQTRSADLARAIATEMELPQDTIEGLRMAGSIHDIGKLSIPAEILSKPTKLTNLEFSLIKEHSRKGYEMLKNVESPWPLAEIVYQHHERMDGSGYPRNLKGEEILIEARILSVADVVEAMASHRPYRPGLGIDAALNEIEKNRGIFYDEAVAAACLRLFREKGFKLEGV
jgi:PAS domain S-box-containing protein